MRHEAARGRTRVRVPRRGLVERKLRLWSGLLIATYVVLHLANHALGLISIEAMERVREWMQALWGTPVRRGSWSRASTLESSSFSSSRWA